MRDLSGSVAMMALSQIGGLFEAENAILLNSRLKGIAWMLGFDHYMLGLEIEGTAGAAPVHFVLSGYPAEWQQRYRDRNYVAVDDTVRHCRTQSTPILWSDIPIRPESTEMWHQARELGLGYGLSVPIHEHRGVHSMLSLARGTPIDPDVGRELCRIAVVIASTAHFAASRLVLPDMVKRSLDRLSERQRDILRLVSLGFMNREIARELKISERTVAFHVVQLLKKLGVRNRSEAIGKAHSVGLMDATDSQPSPFE